MSIFGSIKDAIFGHAAPAPAAPAAPAAPHPAQTVAAAAPAQAAAHPAPAPAAPVDVEAILADKATKLGRPNNWRVSIVDLMTLLGLDLAAKRAHRWRMNSASPATCMTARR